MSNDRQDDIFDLLLEQAMEAQTEQELEQIPSDEELKQRYQLSENFRSNMDKLIAKEAKMDRKEAMEKKCRKLYKVAAVLAACLVISLLLWQIPPVRAEIEDKVFKFYEDFVQIGGKGSEETIDPMKDPDYIPEGYIEVERVEEKKTKSLVYQSDLGVLRINYIKAEDEEATSLYDKDLTYTKIKLLDIIEAYLFYDEEKSILWWQDNAYTYCIRGQGLRKEQVLKVAESIIK